MPRKQFTWRGGDDKMSYSCPYCSKEFKKSAWITNHVRIKHHAQLKLNVQNNEMERLRLTIIAQKITKVPKTINIPTEYLGAFNTND